MKNKKGKEIVAWIMLVVLLVMILIVTYIRFFGFYDYDEDKEITNVDISSSEAIDNALNNIVDNFNADEEIVQVEDEGIKIKALLKNHSVYIYYTDMDDVTTTYEFSYGNLLLKIKIKNEEENLTRFNLVYKILIKAIQKRINNDIELDEMINSHISDDIELNGITKVINDTDDVINYQIDITKKIEMKEGSD